MVLPIMLVLRLQVHTAEQVLEARVGAQPIPERVYCEIEHGSGTLLVTLFEQTERLILVAEPRINYARPIKIDISVRGQILEFLGDLQRVSPPARYTINPAKHASR